MEFAHKVSFYKSVYWVAVEYISIAKVKVGELMLGVKKIWRSSLMLLNSIQIITPCMCMSAMMVQ